MTYPKHRRQPFPRKKQTEAALTKACQAELAKLKSAGVRIWWYKVHGGGWAKAGIPDLCIVLGGLSIWVELKKADGVVSPIQAVRMAEIEAAGGVACVCRSVDDLRELIGRFTVEADFPASHRF